METPIGQGFESLQARLLPRSDTCARQIDTLANQGAFSWDAVRVVHNRRAALLHGPKVIPTRETISEPRQMAKCRMCGSEYYSDGDRCFACGQIAEPHSRVAEDVMKRRKLAILSAIILFVGVFVALYAGARALAQNRDALAPQDGVDWSGMSIFGTFLVAVAVGTLLYSLTAVGRHLSAIHAGAEPVNRSQAALLAMGISALVFGAGYFLGATLSESSLAWEIAMALPVLATLLIAAALLWTPRAMFDVDEDKGTPMNRRRRRGWSVLALGVLSELLPPLFGDRTNPLIPFLLLMSGFAVIFAGMAILLGPFGRPWIPGSNS